jgi:hypothetical protein
MWAPHPRAADTATQALPGPVMWTRATRAQQMRVWQRYQTDLSDAGWALIAAFMPSTFMPEARARGR